MIQYRPVKEIHYHEELGQYTSFGICAYRIGPSETVALVRVSDVFLSAHDAECFADRCNRLALDPIHLMDIIADTLGV